MPLGDRQVGDNRWKPGFTSWTLALISLIYALICLLVVVEFAAAAADSLGDDDSFDTHLRLTVLHESALRRVPSCTTSYSEIEVRNTHPKETVVLRGMHALPGDADGDSNVDWMYAEPSTSRQGVDPPQVHVPRFANRSLTLHPGQSVTVPIAFFPVYRSESGENPRSGVLAQDHTDKRTELQNPFSSVADDREKLRDIYAISRKWLQAQSLSKAAAADLAELAEEVQSSRGSPNEIEHVVRARIVAETSHGPMSAPVTLSSLRKNAYGIPDSIIFSDSAIVRAGHEYRSSNLALRDRYHPRNADTSGIESFSACEYDIFVDNPSLTTDLKLLEIFSSAPDLFEIAVMTKSSLNDVSHCRHSNCFQRRGDNTLCQRPNEWSSFGPIIIPPSNSRVYVGTVSLTKELREGRKPEKLGMSDEVYLGYVHFRTNVNVLSISVRLRSSHKSGATDNSRTGNLATSSTVASTNPENSERSPKSQSSDIEQEIIREITAQDPVLSASPEMAEFGLLTKPKQQSRITINVTNHGKVALGLMRVTVALDKTFNPKAQSTAEVQNTGKTEDSQSESKAAGLAFDVSLKEDQGKKIVLEPGATAVDAVVLTCHTPVELDHPLGGNGEGFPLRYSGAIVIRAGEERAASYEEWAEEVVNDPTSSHHLVLEVPLAVSVMHGRIAFDSSSLVFPIDGLDKNDASRSLHTSSSSSEGHMDRSVVFVNRFPVPLRLLHMHIHDSENTPSGSENFCSSRFLVLDNANGMTARIEESSRIAKSGQRWEHISLRYLHPPASELRNGSRDPGVLTNCTLSLKTDKAGEFSVPIKVYSGKLNMLMDSETLPPACSEGLGMVPFPSSCPFDWLSHTSEGAAFGMSIKRRLETLAQVGKFGGKKAPKSYPSGTVATDPMAGLNLLRRFVSSGFEASLDNEVIQEDIFSPLVVDLGAVRPGEVKTRFIYLSNKNPVAVALKEVTADFEGISIRANEIVDKDGKSHSLIFSNGYDANEIPVPCTDENVTENSECNPKGSHRRGEALDVNQLAPPAVSSLSSHSELCTIQPCTGANNTDEYMRRDARMKGMNHLSFLASSDGKIDHDLLVVNPSEEKRWSLPPGSTVQIEVGVRAPPMEALNSKEVTSFVGSGVVLETNQGEVIPIVVSYDVIVGEIELEADSGQGRVSSFGIELSPFVGDDDSEGPDLEEGTVSFRITSSFQTSLTIHNISSCSEWFSASVPSLPFRISGGDVSSRHDDESEARGVMASRLKCGNSEVSDLTSFFDCAIRWLEEREKIQAPGCGFSEDEIWAGMIAKGDVSPKEGVRKLREDVRSQAVEVLRAAQNYVTMRYDQRTHLINTDPSSLLSKGLNGGDFPIDIEAIRSIFSEIKEGAHFTNVQNVVLNRIVPTQSGNQRQGGLLDGSKLIEDISGEFMREGMVTFSHSKQSGLISVDVQEIFVKVREVWQEVSELGMDMVTSSLRAHATFSGGEVFGAEGKCEASDCIPDGTIHLLPLSSPPLQTALHIPCLACGVSEDSCDGGCGDHPLSFGSVEVGRAQEIYIWIQNPSDTRVRARIAFGEEDAERAERMDSFFWSQTPVVDRPQKLFLQTKRVDSHPWWTGGSYYISDFAGQSIQSSRHVIVTRNDDNFARATPSVASTSALLVGCSGRRCGFRPDDRKVASEEPREKKTSPIGASAAKGVVLEGKDHETDEEEEVAGMDDGSSAALLSLFPAFGAGVNIIDEVDLDPFERVKLGPLYFRPTSRGRFDCNVYIENSLTGLETVTLTGQGVRGNLVFVDDSSAWDGSDIENRFGRPTLLFRVFSDSGGEHNAKPIGVMNTGDADVLVEDMYISAAGVRLPASRGKRSGRVAEQEKSCSARGFRLVECTDSWRKDIMFPLFRRLISILGITGETVANETETRDNSSDIADKNTFVLRQKERHTIHIDYVPDCSFSSLSTALVVEYRRSDGSGELFESSLYLGFDHRSDSALRCDPSAAARDLLSSLATKVTVVSRGAENGTGIGPKSCGRLSYSFLLFLVSAAAVIICFVLRITSLRLQLNDDFERMLVRKGSSRVRSRYEGRGKERGDTITTVANVERLSKGYGWNWLSTYRSLANLRCGQSELVTFGDNIVRDVVKKHKLGGQQRPRCFDASGGFLERNVRVGFVSAALVQGEADCNDDLKANHWSLVHRSTVAPEGNLRGRTELALLSVGVNETEMRAKAGHGAVRTLHAGRVEKLLASRTVVGNIDSSEQAQCNMGSPKKVQIAGLSAESIAVKKGDFSAADLSDDVTARNVSEFKEVKGLSAACPDGMHARDGLVSGSYVGREDDVVLHFDAAGTHPVQIPSNDVVQQAITTKAQETKGRGSERVGKNGDRHSSKKAKVHPCLQDSVAGNAAGSGFGQDSPKASRLAAPVSVRSQGVVAANGEQKSKQGRRLKQVAKGSGSISREKVTLSPQSSQRSMATLSSHSSSATSVDTTAIVSSPTELSQVRSTTSPRGGIGFGDKNPAPVPVASQRLGEECSPSTSSVTATVIPVNQSSLRTIPSSVDSGIRPPPGLAPPPGFESQSDVEDSTHLSPRVNFLVDESSIASPNDEGRSGFLLSPELGESSPQDSSLGNSSLAVQGSDLLAGSNHHRGLDSDTPIGLGGPVVAPLPIGERRQSANGPVSPFMGNGMAASHFDTSPDGNTLPSAGDVFGRGNSINVMNILGGLLPDSDGQPVGESTAAPVTSTADPWQQTYNPFPPSMPLGINPIAASSASASAGLGSPLGAGTPSFSAPVIESEEDLRVLGGIPLLTPASLLLADRLDAAAPIPLSATTPSQVNPNEADDDRKDDEFGKDSFYARLLGD